MKYKINKQTILEEINLNPFKLYAKYKVNKDLEKMENDTFKQEQPEQPTPADSAAPEQENIVQTTLSNIKHHNDALNDALAMLK